MTEILTPIKNDITGLFELMRIEWEDCTPVSHIAYWDGISKTWHALQPEDELTPEDIKALYE
jgi:hypothetical protein